MYSERGGEGGEDIELPQKETRMRPFATSLDSHKYSVNHTQSPFRHVFRDSLLEELWTRDRKVTGSNPGWSGGRISFPLVNFLC